MAISCWSWLLSSFMCKCSQCLQRQLCLQATRMYSAAPKISFVTACIHPPGDSKHFTNTKLSRQVQCPQLFRADFLAAALVNFLLLAFAWGLRAETVKRCQSNMGPSSSSSLEQLNDTRKNKAGGLQGNLDWILEQAPGRQTASTQSSLTSQGCPCCAPTKTKTLALIYKSLNET